MRIEISYWSKGEHEELALHAFDDTGSLEGIAQFERREGGKVNISGSVELLRQACEHFKTLSNRMKDKDEASRPDDRSDRARPATA